MITAERLASLTNVSAEELTRAMKDSGYRDERFLTARFLGMTNNLQFCYQVQFSDDEDQLQVGKVFLTYNPVHGTVIAEY
jgi:hypothetical protein